MNITHNITHITLLPYTLSTQIDRTHNKCSHRMAHFPLQALDSRRTAYAFIGQTEVFSLRSQLQEHHKFRFATLVWTHTRLSTIQSSSNRPSYEFASQLLDIYGSNNLPHGMSCSTLFHFLSLLSHACNTDCGKVQSLEWIWLSCTAYLNRNNWYASGRN